MKVTPFDLEKLISLLPDGFGVSEEDRMQWLDNPCTAAFFYMCVLLMREKFQAHLDAKNMYDVCEQRGAYGAVLTALSIPSRIPVVQVNGLSRETASTFQKCVEELFDGFRPDDDDPRGGKHPDDE